MTGSANGQLARDCGELVTAVAVARATIERGGHADLEALVERLRELLDEIGAIPAAEQQALLPQLMGLAEEIEALGGTIDGECRRCSEALAKGGASARAVAAYAKTDLN